MLFIPITKFCDVCEAKKSRNCKASLYPHIFFIDGDDFCKLYRAKNIPNKSSCDLILKRKDIFFIELKYWFWAFVTDPQKMESIIRKKISGSIIDAQNIFQNCQKNKKYFVCISDLVSVPINKNDPFDVKKLKRKLNHNLTFFGAYALKIDVFYKLSVLKSLPYIRINGEDIKFYVKICKEIGTI